MQQAISAAVGINAVKSWYPAGSDLCLCLICGHVEPFKHESKGVWGTTASLCVRKSDSEMFAENLAFGIELNLPEEVVIAIRAKELGYIEP